MSSVIDVWTCWVGNSRSCLIVMAWAVTYSLGFWIAFPGSWPGLLETVGEARMPSRYLIWVLSESNVLLSSRQRRTTLFFIPASFLAISIALVAWPSMIYWIIVFISKSWGACAWCCCYWKPGGGCCCWYPPWKLLHWNETLAWVVMNKRFGLLLLLMLLRVDLILRFGDIGAFVWQIWVESVIVVLMVVATLILNITDFSTLIILPLLDLEYFIFRGEVNMLLLPLEDFV